MRSRPRSLRRLCWQAARAMAVYTVDGMTGYGLAMYAVPRSALLDDQIDPPDLADPADLAVTLSRRERRQWSRLTRQLQ